ncbi:MAG TPA: DNA-processing protein DprA [Methylibium sp.]
MDRDELAAWLRLLETPQIGPVAARKLLAALGSPQAIFEASAGALRGLLGEKEAQALQTAPESLPALLDATWTWLQTEPGRHLLTLGDADYPAALLECADPPLLLYAIGRLETLRRPALAVVGSRNPTPQGLQNATAFAESLSRAGLAIVSGLALGIDGAAHEGALRAAGSTIAVVGTGLDRVYPKQHRELAHRIGERGLLLSEYPLGMPPLAPNFPKRNRIISGLARGTLVVEAALQSGSLITARLAAEMGREVFAIPGSIHAPQSRGCHALIEQGAKLVDSAQDVLEELRLELAAVPIAPSVPAAAGAAKDAVLDALGYDPVNLDALSARTGMDPAALSARLLELELEGQVARLPGQLFQRLARG